VDVNPPAEDAPSPLTIPSPESRKFVRYKNDGHAYLAAKDEQRPALMIATQLMDGLSAAFDVDKAVEELGPDAGFVESFGKGFTSGGVTMVSDGTALIKNTAAKAGQYFKLFFTSPGGFSRQVNADVRAVAGTVTDTLEDGQNGGGFPDP